MMLEDLSTSRQRIFFLCSVYLFEVITLENQQCVYAKTNAQINCAVILCLCLYTIHSIMPLLNYEFEISSFKLFSVVIQPGLCQTWSEIQINGFLM